MYALQWFCVLCNLHSRRQRLFSFLFSPFIGAKRHVMLKLITWFPSESIVVSPSLTISIPIFVYFIFSFSFLYIVTLYVHFIFSSASLMTFCFVSPVFLIFTPHLCLTSLLFCFPHCALFHEITFCSILLNCITCLCTFTYVILQSHPPSKRFSRYSKTNPEMDPLVGTVLSKDCFPLQKKVKLIFQNFRHSNGS